MDSSDDETYIIMCRGLIQGVIDWKDVSLPWLLSRHFKATFLAKNKMFKTDSIKNVNEWFGASSTAIHKC